MLSYKMANQTKSWVNNNGILKKSKFKKQEAITEYKIYHMKW